MLVAFLGISLLLTATIPHADAVNSWHKGGTNQALISGTKELNADVNVKTPPNQAARDATTLYWMGGLTSNNYLTQVELRAWSSTEWKVFFETVNQSTGVRTEIVQTNLNVVNAQSVELDNRLTTSGQDCMYALRGSTQVSSCLSAVNYGTSFSKAWGEFESYDYTASDFAPMGSPIQFTDFKAYKSDGSTYFPTYSAYNNLGGPSCISATAGSGWVTITENC